jgi:hypothetical protein
MTAATNQRQLPVETDCRLPSGEWTGFWLQRPCLRGQMELHLTFGDGLVNGEGRDMVGDFCLRGHYDRTSGKVVMSKTYAGQHTLTYSGWAEQALGIWGVWKLGGDKGGFHIWHHSLPDPTGSTLRAGVAAPADVGEAVAAPD